jgi:hypothetical protein
MHKRIVDPEVRLLAGIAATLQPDYVDPNEADMWRDSPFAWIRTRPSRQKGKIGEQLVAGWCAAKDLNVVRSPDAEADRLIEGRRVEIKFSTLWKSGVYKFQQIREQNYEYAICLGISPFDAHCWVITKSLLREHVIGHTPQHMGRRGSDTAWLSFSPSSPPEWLSTCGGTLRKAARVISSF